MISNYGPSGKIALHCFLVRFLCGVRNNRIARRPGLSGRSGDDFSRPTQGVSVRVNFCTRGRYRTPAAEVQAVERVPAAQMGCGPQGVFQGIVMAPNDGSK